MRKALFVTGASSGTGYAIAEKFAKNGYDVFITSRKEENAQKAAEKLSEKYGIHAKGYELHIRDENAVKSIFEDIDHQGCFVETLCLNAADLGFGKDPAIGMPFFELEIEEFQKVLETNLVWNFMIIRQAAIRMKKQHHGAIVFIGSNSALRPNLSRVAYITSKGGMNSMSRALAVDLGRYGIRSNVVMPGTIKTPRWEAMGDRQITNGEMVPLGDITDFEDIANAVYFLGRDDAKNITGTEIVIDGGMSCQLYPELLVTLKEEKRKNEQRGN